MLFRCASHLVPHDPNTPGKEIYILISTFSSYQPDLFFALLRTFFLLYSFFCFYYAFIHSFILVFLLDVE